MDQAGVVKPSRGGLPAATISRLVAYLGVLNTLAAQGVSRISSGELAQSAGVNPAQLRKDLSHLGSYGTRGVGYEVEYLRAQLGVRVGSAQQWSVIIVGVGNLGRALINNAGFAARGFAVTGLFDIDPSLVGTGIEGRTVLALGELAGSLDHPERTIGVITTPQHEAQRVCDELVSAGIKSVLNFAPVNLSAPQAVTVRRVDLGSELQILAYHQLSLGGDAATG